MNLFRIILAIIYLSALCCYFYVEVRPQLFKYRIIVKIFLAISYLILASINIISSGATPFKIMVLVACGCACIGDVCLLFEDKFSLGVVGFFGSNLFLLAGLFEILKELVIGIGDIWWSLFIFVAIYGSLLVAQLTGYATFGKNAIPLNIYIILLTLTASLAVGIATTCSGLYILIYAIGINLFMISDYCLGFYIFKTKNNNLLRINSGAYFCGLFLIALSTAL